MREHILPGHPAIIVTFKWWERPRWLWVRHAEARTTGYLADMRHRLNQTGEYTP